MAHYGLYIFSDLCGFFFLLLYIKIWDASEVHDIVSSVCVVAVLPKFEVVIDAPDVIYHEETLQGSVIAKLDHRWFCPFHLNVCKLIILRDV